MRHWLSTLNWSIISCSFYSYLSNNKTVLYVHIAQSLIDQQYRTEKSRFLVSLTAVSPLTFKFTWIKIVISSAFRDLYRIYGFIEKNYPWNICTKLFSILLSMVRAIQLFNLWIKWGHKSKIEKSKMFIFSSNWVPL